MEVNADRFFEAVAEIEGSPDGDVSFRDLKEQRGFVVHDGDGNEVGRAWQDDANKFRFYLK